jgi:signal transduction histidine kinase
MNSALSPSPLIKEVVKNIMNSSPSMIEHEITEGLRPEEELPATELQLQQSQKLEVIAQLAGSLAHDFNNMLTAIIGYTDLSLRRVDAESPIRRNLEETKKAAERAASLVRQFGIAFKVYLPLIDDAALTNRRTAETSLHHTDAQNAV